MPIENETRAQVIDWTKTYKVIAIVRGADPEQCLQVAQALYDGGIRMMEITYNQSAPESWRATADAIGCVAKAFAGKMLVGAGTVTTPELVDMTAEAGGLFVISPDPYPDVIARTRQRGLVSMPGAMTATEAQQAFRAGADFVKLFPVGNLGAGYLKALKAPLSHIAFLAVGGVDEKNAVDFLKAGAAGVGIGGNLANKEWIAAGQYDKITEAARKVVAAIESSNTR